MRQETAYRLLTSARRMIYSLATERSDVAWLHMTNEQKANLYDSAVSELKNAIFAAENDDAIFAETARENQMQRAIISLIMDALGTEETGSELVKVASDAHRAEMELSKLSKSKADGE